MFKLIRAISVITVCCLSQSLYAGVYKCTVNGFTTYSDIPCKSENTTQNETNQQGKISISANINADTLVKTGSKQLHQK